jgi:catechol 2,3-dioxygenase-like lactoylglutathione lyase family enzyme
MPYKVSGLRSWNMNVESFESAVRFYRDALGAEETTRHQVAGPLRIRL